MTVVADAGPLIGLVGLLLEAKRQDLIPHVAPLLWELQQEGYWISDDIIEAARKAARE